MVKRALLVLIPILSILSMKVTATKFLYQVPKPTDSSFYIYKDSTTRINHFIPAGWMGSFKSLKINTRYISQPNSTDTALQITYMTSVDTETTWAGMYWQSPANNWGDKRGGFNLSNYTKLKFKARGEHGGEYIDKFFMGGIKGQTEDGDSDAEEIDNIELTKDWKEYTIDLSGRDLSHIIGGFGWAANSDYNAKDITFYIDEIRYEK